MSVAVFLYSVTANMALPWLAAGYMALIVDIQHPPGLTTEDGLLWRYGVDLRKGFSMPVGVFDRVAFVGAFPPCDHLAVSGARWFKGKGLRKLETSIAMFATAAEFCEQSGAPYFIENPVSTIATYWRPSDHTFNPWQFADLVRDDNYAKKTCLWTGGGFVMPNGLNEPLSPPDNRIHTCPPGPERHNIRSATPMGFAHAVFNSNVGIAAQL